MSILKGNQITVDGVTIKVNSLGQLVASAAGPAFIDGVTPAGTIDGTNTAFTLPSNPNPATSLALFRNGLLYKVGSDYTLAGSTITFIAGQQPQSGDTLLANFRQ